MTLELDDEALDLLHEYDRYMQDGSYANHLAHKIWKLWKEAENG